MFSFFNKKREPAKLPGAPMLAGQVSVAELQTNLQKINTSLYSQNLELAVKNKTLSLLAKLYEISIQSLEPKELAGQITTAVQKILDVRMVGIYLFNEELDELSPIGFSATSLVTDMQKVTGYALDTIKAVSVSKNPFFSEVLFGRTSNHTEELSAVWGTQIPVQALEHFQKEAHLKTVLAHPLIIGNIVIGVLVIALNRTYEVFSNHEKSAVISIVNVVAVALDKAQLYQTLKVTNEKLADANERLKELDQLKSEFVSLATHQIRGPLTTIKGYSSLMLEGDYGQLPKDLEEPVNTIFQACQALVVIVEDFLNVSRIEQGKMKYDFSNFDLCELVRQVALEAQPNVKKRGLALNVAPCSEPIEVSADKGKIKQVIGNIVDNSIKYTPTGSVSVSVARNEETHKVLVTIKDTGVGIKPETIPHLFQKFSRAEDAAKVNILGTGLGLYVAKQMITAHGGRIWVESPGEGKGSTFFIEFAMA